jgi:hypothetical protein
MNYWKLAALFLLQAKKKLKIVLCNHNCSLRRKSDWKWVIKDLISDFKSENWILNGIPGVIQWWKFFGENKIISSFERWNFTLSSKIMQLLLEWMKDNRWKHSELNLDFFDCSIDNNEIVKNSSEQSERWNEYFSWMALKI